MKATARRLAALEGAQRANLDAAVIPTWRDLYRAGASIEERNRAGGVAWVNAAIERHRLAGETLEAYDETFNYQPSGTS